MPALIPPLASPSPAVGLAPVVDAVPIELWQQVLEALPAAGQAALMQTCRELNAVVRQLPALEIHQGRLARRLAAARGAGDAGAPAGAALPRSAGRPARRQAQRLRAVMEVLLAEPGPAAQLTSLALPVAGWGGLRNRQQQRALLAALAALPGLCPRLGELWLADGPGLPRAAARLDLAGLAGAGWRALGALGRPQGAGGGDSPAAEAALASRAVPLARLTHLHLDAPAVPALPASLWQLRGLVELRLGQIDCADQLPDDVHRLAALTALHLSDWPQLERVRLDLRRLGALGRLELSRLPQLHQLEISDDRPGLVLRVEALDVTTQPHWEEQWPAEPEGDGGPAIRLAVRHSPEHERLLIADLMGDDAGELEP